MSKLTLAVAARDHVQGPETALVTLVEYGDYECPHCGHAYPIAKAVQKHFGAKLRFVFRNFPLREAHPHAQLSAESAEAAGAQGKFWEMHDALFEHQNDLSPPAIARLAQHIAGLDVERWAKDVQDHAFERRVAEDFSSGIRSGVNGTPSFFMNGLRYDGPLETPSLIEAIDSLLG